MPIPRPDAGESREDYLSRGHRALAAEYPDAAQRNAVLYGAWREVRKSGLEAAILEGVRVELEHTPNELEAAEIALDHLREDPDYYTKLKAVERGLTDSGDSCYNGNTEDGMDVRKALDGTKRLIRVANAAAPEGTVSHRKDGDWKKTGGQWVRLKGNTRPGMAATPAAGAEPSQSDVQAQASRAAGLIASGDPKAAGALKVYARLRGMNETAARTELDALAAGKPSPYPDHRGGSSLKPLSPAAEPKSSVSEANMKAWDNEPDLDWQSLADDLNLDTDEDISNMDDDEIKDWVKSVASERGIDLSDPDVVDAYGK